MWATIKINLFTDYLKCYLVVEEEYLKCYYDCNQYLGPCVSDCDRVAVESLKDCPCQENCPITGEYVSNGCKLQLVTHILLHCECRNDLSIKTKNIKAL